jgi:hypothetical protein
MAEFILSLGKCKDFTGLKYHSLTFISFVSRQRRRSTRWLCRCDCGAEFEASAASVLIGDTTSCGCRKRAHLIAMATKHGGHGTPEYQAWEGMRRRCCCPTERAYPNYGGRGITVCERWQGENGFANFLSDMGPRPSPKHTLDREENNGNYEPSNCRWATWEVQSRNKRNNVVVTHAGETMTAWDWAKRLGISSNTLYWRLKHWTVERALTTPPGKSYPRPRKSQD